VTPPHHQPIEPAPGKENAGARCRVAPVVSGACHRRRRPEDSLQRAIVQHYRQRAAPGVFMFAVPNGGYWRPVEAAILKSTGAVAGVPDMIWIKDGQVYGLELKAEGGRSTEAQLATIAKMEERSP
jgi:hypothetical protein